MSLPFALWPESLLSKSGGLNRASHTYSQEPNGDFCLPRSAGACTAAAFLREFVTHPKWAHLDIAGVMTNKDDVSCLRKGMTGRPTRTLIEFLVRFSQDSA